MPVKILRLERGDTIALPNRNGSRSVWRVDRRAKTGYVLASLSGEPDTAWSHDEIFDAYVDGTTEIWPSNLGALSADLAEMLQSDLESWSPRKVFEAKCREEFVIRADVLRQKGVPAKVAYRRAAKVVLRAFGTKWAHEADRLAAAERAIRSCRKQIKAVPTALASAPMIEPFKLGEYSVRNWYIEWVKSGRDLRALIARDHKRGDHGRRKTCKLDQQTDEKEPLCVYGAMAWVGRAVWMQVPRVTKAYAYKRLIELCASRHLETVSNTTFFSFLNAHFTAFEEHRERYGPRAAYLKYHIFERRALPERALEEVEVDHCLLDIFVTDGKGRTARPWLTVLICRATKMILGIHLSFEVPSYASLSRAVIHAMAPKDLSGMPEIENDWPCHGVFDMLITDRGLEFLSESFQRAARDLKFANVNLPGRMPHLKGTVERFFGSMGVRVLTHLEGTTFSRTDQFYDPQARARYTLAELTGNLVKWIVDDYHQTEHSTLGMAPIKRWKELVEEDEINGGVRPVGNFTRLVMLMGERVKRKISNVGIFYDNNLYVSSELKAARKRRGALDSEFQILADVTDRGHLWVLDREAKRWLVVPAVNQKISRGLNKFAWRIVMRMARKIVGKGERITDDNMLDARERCEREALTLNHRSALRFCSDGAIATDLIGNNGILSVLTHPSNPINSEDEDQGVLFPDLPKLPARLLMLEPASRTIELADPTQQARDANVPQEHLALPQREPSANGQAVAPSSQEHNQVRSSEPSRISSLRSLIDRRTAVAGVLR